MDKRYAADYVAKPVLTLEGEALGVVKSAVFSRDLGKIVGLTAFDEESEEEFTFDLRVIYRAGENAVLLGGDPRPPKCEWRGSPVGLPAFSLLGEYLGRIVDVALEDERTVAVVAEKGEYAMDRLIAAGEGAALIDTAEERTVLPARRRARRSSDSRAREREESAEPAKERAEVAATVPAETEAREEGERNSAAVESTARIVCGDKLLIGRKLKRDIFNQRGDRIAKEGERITRDVLEKAKKYGLLFDLTVGSLSNLL